MLLPQRTSIPFGCPSSKRQTLMKYGNARRIVCCSTSLNHGKSSLCLLPLTHLKRPLRRHPCNEKPTVVSDIGLRLSEGVKDLKLDQQLAPTREAITRTITAGSTGFFKAVEGVRGRWQRTPSSTSVNIPSNASVSSVSSTPVEVSTPLAESLPELLKSTPPSSPLATAKPIAVPESPQRQKATVSVDLNETRAAIGAWGAGIGSFLSTKAARFSLPRVASITPKASPVADAPKIMEEAPKASEAPVDTKEQENDKKADPEDVAVKNLDDTEHGPTTAPMMATAL